MHAVWSITMPQAAYRGSCCSPWSGCLGNRLTADVDESLGTIGSPIVRAVWRFSL
jgi:hypothetical protein